MQPNSPLFPPALLTLKDDSDQPPSLFPTLPEKPMVSTGSIQIYIIPTEKKLFIEGFLQIEYENRPPTLLRGCLYVRVLKPTKLKSITLHFKGVQRTDWPEGIPPKKVTYAEVNEIVNHTWPFFQFGQPTLPNGGADHFRELSSQLPQQQNEDISHLSLAQTQARSISPRPRSNTTSSIHTQSQLQPQGTQQLPGAGVFGDFFARTISLSPASGLLKIVDNNTGRALSPSPSFADLRPVSTDNSDGLFIPGDYIYNFEHPIPPSTPESCKMTFGEVNYYLECHVARSGTFKLNLQCRLPIDVVRTPAEDNLEINEPIVITRDWEDQLKYDIVIGSKAVVLNSYLPLAFRFVPTFGKVALHRIRVYMSENMEYYCNNKKVHRMEPQKKYLLLEHKALKGKSLLSKDGGLVDIPDSPNCGDENEEVLPRELEFQVFVPESLVHEKTGFLKLHPDTSFDNIKSHHWIKICLRISRFDPSKLDKRKHFEIRIDSPISVLSSNSVQANTLLPAYSEDDFSAYAVDSPPNSPGVTAVSGGGDPLFQNLINQSTSLDAMIEQSSLMCMVAAQRYSLPSRSRSPTIREFQHINTARNNDSPIERDFDMHLESNIYKPSKTTDVKLNSPQAMPYESPTGPPIVTPVSRPIHLIRKPSINPPSFDVSTASPLVLINPPPDYESLDRVMEDVPDSENRTDIETADDEARRGRSRHAEIPNIEISNLNQASLTNTLLASPSNANEQVKTIESSEEAYGNKDEETDITEAPPSPSMHIRFEETDKHLSPKLLSTGSRSPNGIRSRSSDSYSRKSSIASLPSLVSPIERTPLLNESVTSLEAPQMPNFSRSSSIISLLQNGTMNSLPSKKQSFGVVDLHDDIFKINGNLLQLRNPRIKKHYQEEEGDEDPKNGTNDNVEEGDERDEGQDPLSVSNEEQKVRQKSFGVIDSRINRFRSSTAQSSPESDATSTDDRNSDVSSYKTTRKDDLLSEVSGLNLGYNIIQ